MFGPKFEFELDWAGIDWGEEPKRPDPIIKKAEPDGLSCLRCKEFVLMAEPNQDDGITFKCFLCRADPFR